jgi:perosamine synthetase
MKVVQFKPFFGKEELRAVKDVFKSGWFTEGPKSEEFVKELCALIGNPYGSLAPNGTLALYMGFRVLKELYNYSPGDGVLVPDFTFIASAGAALMADLTPHFVDINPETFQIDIASCERVIADNKKIRAILPVHLFGLAANMDEVMSFAEKHGLDVIEDACQALGITWKGKPCGSFGKVGCFSFFADKSISSGGEGGFVTTANQEIADKFSYLRNQGRFCRSTFVHPELGVNFRMNDIQSAIGLAQLKKLPIIVQRKLAILDYYRSQLSEVEQVKILTNSPNSNFIPFRVCITIPGHQQDLSDYMNARGVEARTFFYPLHKQPCYSYLKDKGVDLRDELFPNTINAFEHGLCLPSYVQLSKVKIKYVCDTIKEYFNV